MNFMMKLLRQRISSFTSTTSTTSSPPSPSNSNQLYVPVDTKEEEDDDSDSDSETIPLLVTPRNLLKSTKSLIVSNPRNSLCIRCCLLFSLSGFFFLWIIASLLSVKQSSMYIKVESVKGLGKKELARGVAIASYMYLFVFVVSCFILFRVNPFTICLRPYRKRQTTTTSSED